MLAIILFLDSLGGGELMVIMLFILIFFGSNKIPDLARGLGRGIREFKDAMQGVQSEIRQGMNESEDVVKAETKPESQKPHMSNEVKSDDEPPLKSDV
jgi:sec-independent protein translocase protein TatA